MTLTIDPNLARFIEEQVASGRYASTAEALEAGIARLMLDPKPDMLDAQDLTDIRLSMEQMRRGEVVSARHSARQKGL